VPTAQLLLLQVFVLAATNLPWELDQALLRRLDKRVMVALPDSAAREGMLRVSHWLPVWQAVPRPVHTDESCGLPCRRLTAG
jgi:hypothetical protein